MTSRGSTPILKQDAGPKRQSQIVNQIRTAEYYQRSARAKAGRQRMLNSFYNKYSSGDQIKGQIGASRNS